MIQTFLKENKIHFIAVLIFVVIAFAYFTPSMIEGKVLRQSDVINYKGAAKEVIDYREQTGEEPLWTNSMFCGMPDYLISVKFKNTYMATVRDAWGLWIGRPADFIFFYLIGFYLALVLFGVNPVLAIVGSVAYAFSTYFLIIVEAGHVTKALAIGFMPPIIAGVYYSLTKKPIRGALVVAFFLCFQLMTQHAQITYYTAIATVLLALIIASNQLIEKQYKKLLYSSLSLLAAAILAVGLNISNLYFINEYGKYSTRGKSELTPKDANNSTNGLDKKYATDWSYGIAESWTLLIPNYNGGGASDDYKYSKYYKDNIEQYKNYFIEQGYSLGEAEEAAKGAIGGNFYWGAQPFTSGPVYAGAIICFLFILGLIAVPGKLKWWLLTITILSLMLSWGRNLMWFSDIWFDYIPGYNKFRTVSMTLVIAEFSIPLLGILALDRFIRGKVAPCDCKPLFGVKIPSFFNFTKSYTANVIIKAFSITAGILIVFALFSSGFLTFKAPIDDTNLKIAQTELAKAQISGDSHKIALATQATQTAQAQMVEQDANRNPKEMIEARKDIFISDVWRSIALVTIAALLLLLWSTDLIWEKQNKNMVTFAFLIGFFILYDLWAVNKRYLNSSDFVSKSQMETPYTENPADTYILQNNPDKARVLNLAVSTFNDASTSYFHQSIGGYHGAKMEKYQELIEAAIMPEMQRIIGVFNNKPTQASIDSVLNTTQVLNMLNTKFIIYSVQSAPLVNQYNNGAAWLIEKVKFVPNADAEINEVSNNLKTKTEIVVDQRYKKDVTITSSKDSSAYIKRTSYKPNHLTYDYSSKTPSIAVFSEIYYDKGWEAYIDGKPAPYFRADYLLRAMNLPAGKHTVEFKFQPSMYNTAGTITLISFILLIGFTIFYIVDQIRRKDKALE